MSCPVEVILPPVARAPRAYAKGALRSGLLHRGDPIRDHHLVARLERLAVVRVRAYAHLKATIRLNAKLAFFDFHLVSDRRLQRWAAIDRALYETRAAVLRVMGGGLR